MIAGIDIGSYKIVTLIGEPLPGHGMRVLGIGHAPASGIRRGEIVHLADAAGAIAASVERAERVAGVRIDEVTVGITGHHLEGLNNESVIPCGRRTRVIEAADVDRLLELAGAVPLAPGREVLHVLPHHFTVDDGAGVVSPVGMEGYRLGALVHIVTSSGATLANLRRCLELAEVPRGSFVMSTLAAALATLTPDERELGSFVVDLGASCTGLACYREGALIHSAVLRVASSQLTNDLAVVLQTPLATAERTKITHGHVLPELDDETARIEIETFGDDERRVITRRYASEILAARLDQLASLIAEELERVGLAGRLPAGAVLVGGGAELGGIVRRLAAHWECPVRIGRPTGIAGLADAVRGPGHAGVVGLLLWRARDICDAAIPAGEPRSDHQLARALSWFRRAFLPNSGLTA